MGITNLGKLLFNVLPMWKERRRMEIIA